ncbi:helix-turn-helix domain-containing protein (plasmid) [Rhodococcus sp. NyZ502]|uniref:helix-turn-helix domain-containing protein n=2 Tax=Rhodococcus TaxID=1827 RepID=UPI000F61C1E6|nr:MULTISPECIES: helix-turn-helix transcriptional regulator [unclassified Rhodococcus (in: high G+C Gram-positive bacteria)]AZI65833.1 XRE family transcriptional regulator [Rhodococcus sp. NJ-530]
MVSSDGRTNPMSRNVLRGFDKDAFAAARKAARMSRGDVARLADTTAATIRNWEIGAVSPQIDFLARAANALNIQVGDVVVTDPEERFLSDYRCLVGLTQPQLGKVCGLTTTTITRIERGEIALTDKIQTALAEALGISGEQVNRAYMKAKRRPPGTPA